MTDPTDILRSKTLAMIIGPAAIGKSTIMHMACERDETFAYVQSFTTRPDRGDGRSTYRHLSEADIETLAEDDAVITALRHPTTGHIYGTTLRSYPGKFNLLDTLSDSVGLYQALPFKRTITVSLTADPDAWETWLQGRYPQPSDERTKRLREAILSIEWSLAQGAGHRWLVNRPERPGETAERLISIVKEDGAGEPAPPEASELLARARLLLSYG